MTTLSHYTCDHGHRSIGDAGLVAPLGYLVPDAATKLPLDAAFMADVAWFTDLDSPNGCGLERYVLACDRRQYRYRVDPDDAAELCTPWLTYVRDHLADYRASVRLLNLAPGALPGHWYVAASPVQVTFDPAWAPSALFR